MKPLTHVQLLAYGGLGLPLAFAALPLYVHLVPFYGQTVGLGLLGLLLLGLRFLDAAIDPLIGVLFDRFPHPRILVALSLPLLGIGWTALFNPQLDFPVVAWLILTLTLTTIGYSLATVVHTSWGARIHADPHQRTRLFASREGFGLIGVVLAAALPLWLADTLQLGLPRMGWIFILLLLAFGMSTLLLTPPVMRQPRSHNGQPWRQPFANPVFVRFMPGFLLSGVAAALPATLVIFFIDDVLNLSSSTGVFLAIYFASGALGLPLWVALARRIGKLEAWLVSMLLAVMSFTGAFWLGAGDWLGFALVCAASGLALGADLALPPALVADYLERDHSPQPGAYYGLLSFLAKFVLALAAGLALPLLDLAGYVPGGQHTQALSATYALLPCLLKLAAIGWFWTQRVRLQSGVCPC